MLVRAACEQDLEAIEAIQSAAPEASQWKPRDYLSYECCVAEESGVVTGFSVTRQTAETEWEILNLAVAPRGRRRGVGRSLLEDIVTRRRGEIFLEVRASNSAARRLYEKAGFCLISERLQYYYNPVETAIVMKLYS